MAKAKKNIRLPLKVAIVHDYLREYGGAERVLEALHQIWPQAPVFVGFVDKKALGSHAERFADWQIYETWLSRIPFIKQLYSPLRILAAKAFESLDLSQFDLVISSSNAYFAKAVKVPNGIHICYCHTPPRALYGYTTKSNWRANPVTKFVGTLINHYCRVIDWQVSQRVDHWVANSEEVRRRIAKFYKKPAVVINPPVQLAKVGRIEESWRSEQNFQSGYYFYVNRLALAKHPELAVMAANQLKLPLIMAGVGPMQIQLQELAGPTVRLIGEVTDTQLAALYQNAQALIYPVEDEDFGMVPVEAMQAGVPVIAHRSGGPRESIVEGVSGVFFDQLTVTGLVAAIKKFQKHKWDRPKIAKKAHEFGFERFKREILGLVKKAMDERKN